MEDLTHGHYGLPVQLFVVMEHKAENGPVIHPYLAVVETHVMLLSQHPNKKPVKEHVKVSIFHIAHWFNIAKHLSRSM